jgi:hypothetical protein
MSLAIYAAPFDDNNRNDNENLISQKKISHNKTQKRHPKSDIDSKKVNSVLQSIHENSSDDDEDNLGDYYENPPPNPMSIGAQRAAIKEGMQNSQSIDLGTLGAQPNMSNRTNNYELNSYMTNYGDEKTNEEFYKKYVPNFTAGLMQNPQQQKQKYSETDIGAKPYMDFMQKKQHQMSSMQMPMMSSQSMGNNDVLIEKLNYMINLLEEKKDEKTNNVTEEVILYSFLGIFIIFVVDGFARVGKYTR